ncbi:MAG: C4-dicarboxylate ABC transporter substrate-binding protein, partial [Mangrovicoccus sp.]
MPSSELFEALNSGVIDATYSSIPDLKNAQLYDVVKSVSLIELGVFNAAATMNASQLLWMRMDDEEREALAHAAQYGQSVGVVSWSDTEKEAKVTGAEKGIEFVTPSDELLAKAREFNETHLATVAETLEGRGVKDAAAKVERYKALVEKWHGLVTEDTTAEELAELRWTEIFSKIDYSSYGM